MKEAEALITEPKRRKAALWMMVVGWIGIQGYVVWALVVDLLDATPAPPGALPLWTGPIAFDLFLFAVVGTMLRSRMRFRDTITQVFLVGIRAARRQGVTVQMEEMSFVPNDEKPPTDGQGA